MKKATLLWVDLEMTGLDPKKDKILEVAFGSKGIKDGSIVLLHDIHRESVDATKEMIVRLKKEGYTFVTVPELLSVRKGGMQAGQSYSNGY